MNAPLRRWSIPLSILFLLLFYGTTLAHRHGCHRWHSCPSDSGKYICGDLGKCSGCPDNEYCQGGGIRTSLPENGREKNAPPRNDSENQACRYYSKRLEKQSVESVMQQCADKLGEAACRKCLEDAPKSR